MSWTWEENSRFTFWVPGTPLVCFQWLLPSPLTPPALFTSANIPSSHPPLPPTASPKFSGNSFNRPHHPFFLSPALPLLSPFGIPFKLLPSQQTSPLLPFFLALSPLDGCKRPQDCGSFSYSPFLQTRTSFSDSGLATSGSLYPLLCLSSSLSPSHQDVKYSQLLLRSGSTATRLSEQTEELWTCEANGVRFIWGPTQVR